MTTEKDQDWRSEDAARQVADDAAQDARRLAEEEVIARGDNLEDSGDAIEAAAQEAWDAAYQASRTAGL
jgi:hypothetical protein